ncbi:MAG: GGDEF domain-containing protein [Armatimonadota bacterium]|nr:GGDEF domain-containing protein [Armatimonadota bacterium]
MLTTVKTVEQVMRRDVPTIGPASTVADAVALVCDSEVSALPVVDGERLVGLLTLRDLLRALPYRPVAEIMTRNTLTAARQMPLAGAYTLMEERGISQLPVVDDGRLIGMITIEDVLRELGRPIDPLTGLPWATALRERAEQLLKDGQEIALIFLDLDNFGLVNKHLGHVVGDQLIKNVAAALQAGVDPSRDLLCRYGGDEFAILTTRPRPEAEALARRMLDAVASIHVPEGHGEFALAASTGIAGGKRTGERQDVHFAATVDDLITIASLQSTQAKIEKTRQLAHVATPSAPPPPGRMRLVRVDVSMEGVWAEARVELRWRGRRFAGQARGPAIGSVPVRLVAEATVQAVSQALPEGWVAAADEVRLIPLPPDVLVVVTVLLGGTEAPPERYTGAVVTGPDHSAAAARAALHAVNRRLGQILK